MEGRYTARRYTADKVPFRRVWQSVTGQRRIAYNLTRMSLKMVSDIVHCSPVGLILQPPATLTLRLDPGALAESYYQNEISVYSWDLDTNAWERIEDFGTVYLNVTNTTIGLQVSIFSTFVAMVPVDIKPPLLDDLVVPAIVITLLVLGAAFLCLCWCQSDFILKRASIRPPEKIVEEFDSAILPSNVEKRGSRCARPEDATVFERFLALGTPHKKPISLQVRRARRLCLPSCTPAKYLSPIRCSWFRLTWCYRRLGSPKTTGRTHLRRSRCRSAEVG